MSRKKRQWHEAFLKYMDEIVKNPAYSGMPEVYKADGTIRWVSSAKSDVGQKRRKWLEKKRDQLGILPHKGDLVATARKIHPTGEKPCQICGKSLKLDYVYPTKKTLNKINSINGIRRDRQFTPYDKTIGEIITAINEQTGSSGLDEIRKIFSIPSTIPISAESYSNYVISNCKSSLSPGAMGDPPDRLDGYHSYNNCCRPDHDTGRSKSNLSRYGQDRRVYETWADGDWKRADWLMQEFKKRGKSPDHIGPISQGFCHPTKFRPMTLVDNINKRDRLGIKDLKDLISDECEGNQVVSWHTKYVWNKLKNVPANDSESELFGQILRKNLHNVLIYLYKIKQAGYEEFLKKFLHPEFAYFSHSFEEIDFEKGILKTISTKGDKKQYANNASRYIRKSLEALDLYNDKDNRRQSLWEGDDIKHQREKVISFLKQGKIKEAEDALNKLFEIFSNYAEKEFLEKKSQIKQ